MKLDPDERLTDELKASIREALDRGFADGFCVQRRLWFMGKMLPVRQEILRIWRTGTCSFSNVLANEQPLIAGRPLTVVGDLEHHDSPNLHHWLEKQNAYTTAEAYAALQGNGLAVPPRLFGTALERRMWIKSVFFAIPFRYALMHSYYLFGLGAWQAGREGQIWAKLRTEVFRMWDYKLFEMRQSGKGYLPPAGRTAAPDIRATQYD